MIGRHRRRGSYAIEFALILPVLVLLLAGSMDLAQYLLLSDGLVVSVAEGARAGAQTEGAEPAAVASKIAEMSWANASLPASLTIDATIAGVAPDQWLVVTGKVPFSAFFGVVKLPEIITYTSTVRIVHQQGDDKSKG